MAQRGKKPSMPQYPGDFIALGPKPGGSGAPKRDAVQSGVAGGVGGPSNLGKSKPKALRPSPPSSVMSASSMLTSSSAFQDNAWETLAIDCDPTELKNQVEEAEAQDNSDRVEGLLLGGVKNLKNQRAKPDPVLYLSLMYLSKSRDYLFLTKDIIEAFCSLLKRDVKEAYKSKGNALVSVFSANVLMSALRHERQWPDTLVKVYIEDAIGERIWVDHPDCKGFVENICTAFDTKMPASNIFFAAGAAGSKTPVGSDGGPGRESPGPQGSGSRSGSGSATPTRPGTDDDSQGLMLTSGESLPINVINIGVGGGDPMSMSAVATSPNPAMESIHVQPRFEGTKDTIEHMVVEVVREQINRRQGTDNITRNLIKFLTTACGLMEIRQMVAPKLEMWIMNPKISRPAQDLLMALAMNCNTHSPQDVEVIGLFTKFRFKNKPNFNLYLSCVRELCAAHKENMPTLLKFTVFNELSNARNTNNMAILQVMFNYDKDLAPASLASVYIELLVQKECYLRALRALLREIVRYLRYDINLHTFCLHLMQLPPNKELIVRDFEFRERMFTSITDLITLAIFLGISPQVKEGMTAYIRGDDKKDMTAFRNFLKQTANIQRDACVWMLESVLKTYKPDLQVFPQCLHKVLFMVPSEEYWRVDGWPDEASRNLYVKATSEIPLLQDTLCHIFVIGISKQHPINGRDIIDLAECLVKRAAGLHPLISDDFQVLNVDRCQQVMEFLFQLAAYNYPDSITLPKDYQPPKMAISSAYWKAWQILVLLCSHNPSDFGAIAWENYPTLKAMMEMCITNQFQFPPPTLASGDQADEMRAKELQTATMEKQDILQFEIHLAAATNKATITESNSLLLAQLITNDPEGNFRRPPQTVLDQLAQANQHYKIGHLLCRSRNPDFLLNILNRQGSNQEMPWLADLVESSEGSFNILPVQCLCEFLLNSTTSPDSEEAASAAEESGQKMKKRKQKQLLLHLQNLLQHPVSEEQQRSSIETLDYFMKRLGSPQTHQRVQALKGLQLVLAPIHGEEEDVQVVQDPITLNSEWLLKRLPRIPCFGIYYAQISDALRNACGVENDPLVVSFYFQFLAYYATYPEAGSDLADLCFEISGIIVERSTLLPAILPGSLCKTPPNVANETFAALLGLFNFYMRVVRRRADQPQPQPNWRESDAQELIVVHWPHEQVTATIHFFIVHAQIILLTYGPQQIDPRHGNPFEQLLSFWKPNRNGEMPKACLVDGREADYLIPDWLKLKMIRSEVTPLVDAALVELDPTNLVLFIQSFGIPVPSMSKLLQSLDRAIQQDFEGVNKAVMDKTYMGQLVGVQHQRGAVGGQIFAEMLGLELSAPQQPHLEPPRPSQMATKRPDIIIPPRSTAMIPPGAVKSTLFQLFDVGSPSRMTLKEKRDTFRTLQKYLTSEIGSNLPTRPMLDATVRALEAILIKEKELKEAFVCSMLQHPSFSASLIRLLTSALLRPNLEDLPAAQVMAQVAETFLNDNNKKRLTVFKASPLWKLLEDYLTKRKMRKHPSKPKETETTFEQDIKGQVDEALKKKNTKALVESMANMLLSDLKESNKGTIIDWLQKIDPELKEVSNSQLRQKVLFNKNPHLLTVFSHLSNWTHLKETIDGILKHQTIDEYEPKAVLDFLSTCVFLKMQWQCNDKHKPKHDSGPQDVLELSSNQIEVILDFILIEAKENPEEKVEKIKARIPLIVSCLNTQEKATKAIKYLQETKSMNDGIVKDLILQIYMKLPQSLLTVNGSSVMQNVHIDGNTSQVDTISHFLLSALASTQQGRSWTDQMKEFEAAARKLAATHPLLLLRNLPLLAAGMKGRTDFDFSFFRSRNHMTFYSMALGLLELSVPLIFEEKFIRSLEDCLECYMAMMRNYFARRDAFSGMIEKVVAFLHIYLNHAPQSATEFIKKHQKLLAMYFQALNNSAALTEMSKIIKLEMDDEDGAAAAEDTLMEHDGKTLEDGEIGKSNSSTVFISGTSSFLASEQKRTEESARKLLTNLQSAMTNDDSELIEVLSMIKFCSQSQSAILPYFQEEFCTLISHESKIVRNHAYELYIKLLCYEPNLSHQLIVPFISCLESNDASVAGHAMEKLPDVAPLAQEHLEIVLNTAFNLGLYSNLEVVNPICDTLSLMNGLAGY